MVKKTTPDEQATIRTIFEPRNPDEPTQPLSQVTCSLLSILFTAIASSIHFWRYDLDDGFILSRYAWNLARGRGWVFNVGENYNASTSVLNTVLSAALTLAVGDARVVAHLIGAACILTAGVCFFYILRAHMSTLAAGVSAVGLEWFLAWSRTVGLETNLWIALFFAFVLLEIKKRDTWYLLGVLALARPDLLLLAGARVGTFIHRRRRIPISGILQMIGVVLPWVIYSLLRFHQVLPATLQQKMWQGRVGFWGARPVYLKGCYFSLRNLVSPFSAIPGGRRLAVIVMAYLCLIGIRAMYLRRSPLLTFVGFVAAQQFAYMILEVPDYPWYYVPAGIAAYVAGVYGIFSLFPAVVLRKWSAPLPGIVGPASLAGLTAVALIMSRPTAINPKVEAYRDLSRQIMANGYPGRIAMTEVGTVANYTDRRMLDITGLTSKEPEFMTGKHSDRFFDLSPEIVVIRKPEFSFERAIFTDPRFSSLYGQPVRIVHTPGFQWDLAIYLKRSK